MEFGLAPSGVCLVSRLYRAKSDGLNPSDEARLAGFKGFDTMICCC
jgi:hypothetical protein